MAFSDIVKNYLFSDISQLAKEPTLYAKNPQKDFTRKRILDFETLVKLQISMENSSTSSELLKYFDFGLNTPTVSAFYQQRAKLCPDTFKSLFLSFNKHFDYNLFDDKYRLLACDGSTFTYTRNSNDADCHYTSSGRSLRGYNQVHAVALYDIPSDRYTDAVMQPIRCKNEFQALCTLIDHYDYDNDKPIFVADRGFQSYNVFAHAIEKQAYFVIRAKDNNTTRILGADDPCLDEYDVIVNRILTKSASKKKRLQPDREKDYRYIVAEVPFDFIDKETNPEYEMSLRVVRFQISDTSYENIITNLPQDEYSPSRIKEIYNLRWGIETSFRTLKHTIGAENIHSKQCAYIIHELWARLILYNFCSIITHKVIIQPRVRKHTYAINVTNAFRICRYFLRFHNVGNPPDIENLIGQYILPVRPDRKSPRQIRFQIPNSYNYRY